MFSWFRILPTSKKFRFLTILNAANLSIIALIVFLAFKTYQDKYDYYQTEIIPRQKYLMDIKSLLGYGGVMHYYYIYLMTSDVSSVDVFNDKLALLFETVREYRHLSYITPEEDQALNTIYQTAGIYGQKLVTAIRLKSSGKFNQAEVQEFVFMNESDAIRAFETIAKAYKSLEEKTSIEIGQLLTIFIFILSASLLLLFFSVIFLNYYVFVKPLDFAFDELQKKENLTSIDLQIAKKIQANILPRNTDKFENCEFHIKYLPLTMIGGDVYDIVEMKPGFFRVFLADATGHGIQAALLTMLIKSEYEKMKEVISQPEELLEILNNEFILHYSLNFFFSCIILDIDMNHGKLTYSSAGHPDQYFIRNKKAVALKPTGKMIGMKQNLIYQFKTLDFKPKDKIVLFTDGLFEEFDPSGTLWGEDRVGEIIRDNSSKPVDKIMDDVLSHLEIYLHGKRKNDDITLIGISLLRKETGKKDSKAIEGLI
ncbi:MAG: hypothetical protein A2Y33_09580 [Spirochaetes bacterium GWF1_51_8]|nr:MAG: hypothetical protein A2Y33_09580 [Spirochaetes bacterium GWF1_51_8]